MLSTIKRQSPALVVSLIALIVALSGTATAASGLISSKQLKKNAVTSKKIKNGEVTGKDLGPNSVDTTKVTDGSLATGDLADLSVTTGKLANDAVTTAKIANNAVTTAKIADNAVTTAKIANDAVNADKIAANAVGDSEIAPNAVNSEELANNSVDTGSVSDGSLLATDVTSARGVASLNYGTVAGGACATQTIQTNNALQNDLLHVTAGPTLPGVFTVRATPQNANSTVMSIIICNQSNVDLNPGATNFSWAVMEL